MKYLLILMVAVLAGCSVGSRNANSEDRAHSALRAACIWKTMRWNLVELDDKITYTVTCEREH
jgi:hypothetical protein